jgi:hypothetical protein
MWAREDGEKPKAIERGSRPRGPGRVFEVEATSAEDARSSLARFLGPEPDRRTDRAAWNDWDERMPRVRPVDLTTEAR